MKNNKLVIWFIVVIMLFIGGVIIYRNTSFYISSDKVLSSKEEERSVYVKENEQINKNGRSFNFKKFTGKWSLIEFTANAGNKITINDNTKIEKGKFYIVILDSEYNILAKKDETNSDENIEFTTPKNGKYIIRVAGKNASGKFDVEIDAADTIEVINKEFFD